MKFTPPNKVVLLGFSQFAQRNLLPAFSSQKKLQLIAIASKSRFSHIPAGIQKFNNYAQAIEKANCDTVYVSLHNSAHYRATKLALSHGKHVICDKPMFLSRRQALQCYKLAGNSLIMLESLPYLHHPIHHYLCETLTHQRKLPRYLTVKFGFPSLPANNFRNSLRLGGGCLFDVGPYSISVGERYLREWPVAISSHTHTTKTSQVAISSAVTLVYPNNRIVQALIGFDLEYYNTLEIWGQNYHYSLKRAFTMPVNQKLIIDKQQANKSSHHTVAAANHFSLMLKAISQYSATDCRKTNQATVKRSVVLDTMIRSANTHKLQPIHYPKL